MQPAGVQGNPALPACVKISHHYAIPAVSVRRTNLLFSLLYTKLARQQAVLNKHILKYGEEFIDSGVAGESQDH